MKTEAKNAGTAISKLAQSISLKDDTIKIPTIIKAGAVAWAGTKLITGDKKAAKTKQMAVTTEVKPVRPPAPIPADDSTKVVVLEVPKIAPKIVPTESPNKARSILELKPELDSRARSSSSEKIPERRPVPIKVPTVSKTSDKEKAKIVIKTTGNLERSENKDGIPAEVKITPKV